MIRALIVENEKESAEALTTLLHQYCPQVALVGCCSNVDDAAEYADAIDLLFLDVELDNDSGLNLLKRLDKISFEIIFTTAYEQYALEAIKASCLDYLLKPIDCIALQKSIMKYASRALDKSLQIENLLHNLSERKIDRIAISGTNEMIFITINDIVTCAAEGNYTRIHTTDGRSILASKPLGEYESMLPARIFFRSHKSYLINLNHIIKYDRFEGQITLVNNLKADVATRRRERFLSLIGH